MMPSGVDTLDLCQQKQHSTDGDSEWKRDSPHNDVSYCRKCILFYVILGYQAVHCTL